MRLPFDKFRGSRPAIAPRAVPPGLALRAVNCDFNRNRLDPLPGLGQLYLLPQEGELESIYPHTPGEWLAWPEIIDVAKLPVAAGNGRIAYAGPTLGYPRQTDRALAIAGPPEGMPNESRRLGVLPPTTPLTVTLEGEAEPDFLAKASYAYTMVTAWGEESRPGPITGVFSVSQGQQAKLTGFAHDVDSGNDYTYYRIYRLDASEAGAEYLWLADIPLEQSEFIDDLVTTAGPEVLPTQGWMPPPDTTTGVMQYHDITVTWGGQALRLSPLRAPYAYRRGRPEHEFADPIVGVGHFAETLVILTTTSEHRLHGKDPDYMVREDVPYSRGCVARRSLVSSPAGVFYAAADGLVLARHDGSPLVTGTAVLPQQWLDYGPENLFGFFWRAGYLGFFAGTSHGIYFDIANEELQEIALPPGTIAHGGFYSKETDTIHLLLQTEAGYGVAPWAADRDLPLPLEWESPPHRTEAATAFSLLQVDGEFSPGRTATVMIIADQIPVFTAVITDEYPMRLPLAAVGTEWRVRVTGTAAVDRVLLAQDIEELDQG